MRACSSCVKVRLVDIGDEFETELKSAELRVEFVQCLPGAAGQPVLFPFDLGLDRGDVELQRLDGGRSGGEFLELGGELRLLRGQQPLQLGDVSHDQGGFGLGREQPVLTLELQDFIAHLAQALFGQRQLLLKEQSLLAGDPGIELVDEFLAAGDYRREYGLSEIPVEGLDMQMNNLGRGIIVRCQVARDIIVKILLRGVGRQRRKPVDAGL